MPPKRAAAAKKRPAAAAEAPAKAARVEAVGTKGHRPAVDQLYTSIGSLKGKQPQVYQDDNGDNWAVNLQQTEIGQNNNKYYVIQLVEAGGSYAVFTKWARVGAASPQNAEFNGTLDKMKEQFCSKFKDKTKNDWKSILKGSNFKKVEGKYQMLDMADDEANAEDAAEKETKKSKAKATAAAANKNTALSKPVQDMLKIILDEDMFKGTMKKANLDEKKMPLGKLSAAQVKKGYETLDKIKEAFEKKKGNAELSKLSSEFYTNIPHSFGMKVPPVINTEDMINEKGELLNTLNDMAIAVGMMDSGLDDQVKQLGCGISHVDPKSAEFKLIEKYFLNTRDSTKNSYRYAEIIDVFAIDRPQDKQRNQKFAKVDNRKLLWHGTNVSVVAAILKTGLRIMPHSGGRVGAGVYSADENSKSAGYTGSDNAKNGFMFLNEIILGDAKEITKDDHTLNHNKVEKVMKADSVIARGWTAPDPKHDEIIKSESGFDLVVPAGKPVKHAKFTGSRFSQNEYLVYDEGRVRMKYMLRLKFPNHNNWW